MPATNGRQRLASWKEIAAYLHRDVRTVMRWEKERGLPVSRVPGGKAGRVFAYVDDLDAWLADGAGNPAVECAAPVDAAATSPDPEPVQPPTPAAAARRPVSRVTVVTAAVLLSIVGVFAIIASPSARRAFEPLRRVEVRGTSIVALTETNQVRWSYVLEGAQRAHLDPAGPWGRSYAIADVNDDGEDEVLVSVSFAREGQTDATDVLFCFSVDGSLRWKHVPDQRLTFASGAYGPPWSASDLHVYGSKGRRRIAWAIHHFTWWPAILVTLGPDGRVIDRFVHPGWIQRIAASPDGRFLALSGISNGHDATFAAILDATRPSGSVRADPGSPYACVECPPDAPRHYFVFPRTELSRATRYTVRGPVLIWSVDGGLMVRDLVADQADSGLPAAEAIYEFSPDFKLARSSYGDAYWDWHTRLANAKLIDHAADQCPERRTPVVRGH